MKKTELISSSKCNNKKDKKRTTKLFNLMAKGKMSWATGCIYNLLLIYSKDSYPEFQLSEYEIEEIQKKFNFRHGFLNYHIRNMRELKLVTTTYEFETDKGELIKLTDYKEALKLGIRGMKRSYLILKDLSK